MKIAVLFDGAGLARLGLEQAGHECVGFELNPIAHYLSTKVGSGNCVLADVMNVDLSEFDGVWASPPCQLNSMARTQGDPESAFSDDMLEWALSLYHYPLWVENVHVPGQTWGKLYNAAQFSKEPIQNRLRMVGGDYPDPHVYRSSYKFVDGVCPAILATEYKGCATDPRRASRFYGRRLTIQECAYRQGFKIPGEWFIPYSTNNPGEWEKELYRAIGNGVPVYMAKAFGEAVIE